MLFNRDLIRSQLTGETSRACDYQNNILYTVLPNGQGDVSRLVRRNRDDLDRGPITGICDERQVERLGDRVLDAGEPIRHPTAVIGLKIGRVLNGGKGNIVQ